MSSNVYVAFGNQYFKCLPTKARVFFVGFPCVLGLSPDLVSFNTAIDACAVSENWHEAVRLLEEDMVDAKVRAQKRSTFDSRS